ncbi:hypothetical protein K492DRAFT_205245 [Lichtheimia hyalospora FSU 10163]|nr:hypothetical protein K492DRAFT_205245 [Lichtheimia hyalospora FSU 10163]
MACKHSSLYSSIAPSKPLSYGWPRPIDTTGGQCTWCGKYGHQRRGCPFLK